MKDNVMKQAMQALTGRLFAVITALVLIFLFWNFSLRRNWMEAVLAGTALLAVYTFRMRPHNVRSIPVSRTEPDRTPLLLFLASFAVRFAWCAFINPHLTQVSDFLVLLRYVRDGLESANMTVTGDIHYYQLHAHKFFYPYILRSIGIRTQGGIMLAKRLFSILLKASG